VHKSKEEIIQGMRSTAAQISHLADSLERSKVSLMPTVYAEHHIMGKTKTGFFSRNKFPLETEVRRHVHYMRAMRFSVTFAECPETGEFFVYSPLLMDERKEN